MHRKAAIWFLAMMAGIISSHFIAYADFLSAGILLLAILAVCLLLFVRRSKFRKIRLTAAVCVFVFLLGGFWGYFYTNEKKAEFQIFSEHYITAEAIVRSDPQITRNEAAQCDVLTYTVRVASVTLAGTRYTPDALIRLTIYDGDHESAYQYGDILSLEGELNEMRKAASLGEYDAAAAWQADGIFYEMGLNLAQTACIGHDETFSLENLLYDCRTQLSQNTETVLAGDEAALVRALILGDRSELSEEMYAIFKKSGLAHVLSVSGLHVSILLSLTIGFLSMLRLRKLWRNLIAAVFLVFFMLLTGAAPSVVRAVVCAVIYLTAESFGEETDRLTALGIAAGGMLLLNPFVCFDLSFIMTFLSVLGICFFYAPLRERLQFLKFSYLIDTIAMTVSAQTLIFPILLGTFGYFQPLTLVSNLMALFFMPVILLSCAAVMIFGAVPMLGAIAGAVCFSFLRYLAFCAGLIANIPAMETPPLPWIIVVCYAIGLVLFHRLLRRKKMHVNVILLLSIFLLLTADALWQYYSKDVIITFVNVGQGDAAVLELPGGKIAVADSGGHNYDAQSDKGLHVFVPFLEKKGFYHIDYAILSHFDSDHALGIIHVLESETFSVENLILPYRTAHSHANEQTILRLAGEKDVNVFYVSAGDEIAFAGSDISMRVLSPAAEEDYEDENNASLVFELRCGEVSCLFTGDAEGGALNALAERIDDCELVKVPHHGSADSAALNFYLAARPEYAVISAGVNAYGHPSNEVLSLLSGIGAEVYRTDLGGDIKVTISPDRIRRIETYLKQ